MSRLSLAQSKLNDAIDALESALVLARANPGERTFGESSMEGARLLADLQAVDAKVAKAVEIINASLTASDKSRKKL